MSIQELEQILESAQKEVESYWEALPPDGFSERAGPVSGPARCAQTGCNYRRYPASRFCMYHAPSRNTFAAQLRRAKARAHHAAKGG